ncbi:MAG: fimbrial protein [Pseudomonadota bacterium]
MKVRQRLSGCLFGILVGVPGWVEGEVMDTASVNISVTVRAPLPCVLNDNLPIQVLFDDVITTRVDGKNYRRKVEYSLKCSAPASNAMKFQVYGQAALVGFDTEVPVLQTLAAGLGIAMLLEGKPLAINQWVNFTYPQLPQLEAVLLKQAGVTLAAGGFTAVATLKVEYQ